MDVLWAHTGAIGRMELTCKLLRYVTESFVQLHVVTLQVLSDVSKMFRAARSR